MLRHAISDLFTDKFANRAATADNMLLLAMYRFVNPIAVLLNKIGFSPDQITTLSLISAVLAFIALVMDASFGLFVFFWIMVVVFDLCDGPVARMSFRISARAFRYDHMSDILKMGLVVIGVSIRFDETNLWILCSVFLFIHLYSEIVGHDLRHELLHSVKLLSDRPRDVDVFQVQPRLRDRIFFVRFFVTRLPLLFKFLQQFYVVTFTFNGHTLLVFLLLAMGRGWVYVVILYLTLLSMRSCVRDIRALWQMRRYP